MAEQAPDDAVAIVGSRDFARPDAVRAYIERRIVAATPLISGGAWGVDRAAEDHAVALGWTKCVTRHGSGEGPRRNGFLVVRPNYDLYAPKRAPIHRNALIASLCTRMVAFLSKPRGGTVSAIRFAAHMGKPVAVYGFDVRDRQWRVFSGDDFAYRGCRPQQPLW